MRNLYLTPNAFGSDPISRYNRYQIEVLREIYGDENVRVLSLQGPDKDRFTFPFEVFWHGRSYGGSQTTSSLDRAGFSWQAVQNTLFWKPQALFCAHVSLAPLVTRLGLLSGAQTILNAYGAELWHDLNARREEHIARMDQVITECDATAEHMQEYEMHLEPPEVISTCIDLDRFQPGPRNAAVAQKYKIPFRLHTPLVLTFLEGHTKIPQHQSHQRMIETWKDIRAQVPQAHLVIAGNGQDLTQLKRKTLELGLTDSVTFTGTIDEIDLPALYRLADLFCLVNDTDPDPGETIALPLQEAMACGLPVIVSAQDVARQTVVEARIGRIISPREPAQLCSAIIDLLSASDQQRRTRARAARHIAQERFGYGTFRDKHRVFLSKICA
jgi:phosphatidylinositol alpha-1,6-mannosyltransferase